LVKLPELKRIRERALLTQAALAARSGLSIVTIARAEAGHPVRFETIGKLIDALGVSADDLRGAAA
jgi:transcriptional regulator with XRE-family HTH domain